MTTDSFVGKDSALYQIYDHLYVEKFGTESIAVLIEGDEVTEPETLKAMLSFSDKMKAIPDVIGAKSIADIVADTEERETGIREIPTQGRIDEILAGQDNSLAVKSMMPDAGHSMLLIELPVSLTEKQLEEIDAETNARAQATVFPPDIGVTVTGRVALMTSIVKIINESNASTLALAELRELFQPSYFNISSEENIPYSHIPF